MHHRRWSKHLDGTAANETPGEPVIDFFARFRPFLVVPTSSTSNRLIQLSRFFETGRFNQIGNLVSAASNTRKSSRF